MSGASCYGCGRPVGRSQHRTEFGRPLCRDCAALRQLDGLDGGFAGMCEPGALAVLARGVGPDGRLPRGAESWEYRPPVAAESVHHDQPYTLNGKVMYQQSPPVHVAGSACESAQEERRHLRVITEARAARLSLAIELAKAPRAQVAAALGLSRDQLRRKITARNKERAARCR